MAPTLHTKGKESGTARVLGSGASGVAELLVFHPVDTIAKRLMSNKAKVSFGNMSQIMFREHAGAPIFRRTLSLFPGLGYAAGYKVTSAYTNLVASHGLMISFIQITKLHLQYLR